MGEIVVNIYYEFKLRQVFREAADNRDDVVPDAQTWNYLTALMLRNRLASVKDVELLERYRPSFPLDFDSFIRTVQQAFGDQQLKRLEVTVDDAKEQLENCRTLINMMNIKFLSKDELHQLANIVHQCSKRSQAAEQALHKVLTDIHGYSEDVFGFVWDKIYGPALDVAQIKLPHAYIKQEKAALEKEFAQRRVRSVHYRKQAIKILKTYETGIVKEVAFCADRDFPVECYKIPKEFPHYEVLTQFFNQIGATKELLFSKYLPSYLGFDDLGDELCNQYFFQIVKGRKLKRVLEDTGRTLLGFEPLFKYWAKELLFAFRDLTYRSTYNLAEDVTLKNVFVSDVGIKVYLKKVRFGEQRDDALDYHLQVEAQHLKMYAKLLVEMLTNREDFVEFEGLEIDPELKCILYECYHAKDKTEVREQERYEQEIARFIQREQEKLHTQRVAFVSQVALGRAEEEHKQRSVKRKPDLPQANKKNFAAENERMGVAHELDLLLGEPRAKQELAQSKTDRGQIEYAQSLGEVKKQKQERFLTVQGLLSHPYFVSINEADIAVIIDEFERLVQPS